MDGRNVLPHHSYHCLSITSPPSSAILTVLISLASLIACRCIQQNPNSTSSVISPLIPNFCRNRHEIKGCGLQPSRLRKAVLTQLSPKYSAFLPMVYHGHMQVMQQREQVSQQRKRPNCQSFWCWGWGWDDVFFSIVRLDNLMIALQWKLDLV